MKIIPIDEVPIYSKLGQNIFRHDGLLALPRGVVITQREINEIKYHGIDFVLVYDRRTPIGNENDISFTLGIIESAFLKTTLWEEEFGNSIYDYIRKQVLRNPKIEVLLNQLRIVDSYSFAHCINISLVVVSLLMKQQLRRETLCKMAFFALLHDVGRLKMADIFNKEGKLTEEEYEMIKRHPEESYKLLKKAGFIDEEVSFVSETHEKYNGTGYPFQLMGQEISHLGQLILIADIYNALSSFRPYRDVYSPHEVSKMIEEEKGKSFGEDVIRLFKENFEPYQPGVLVLLDNGEEARVKSTRYSKTLPIVEVISETGEVSQVIDLSANDKIRIKRITSI